MSLTPSDVASLASSLSRWETAEYTFAGLVVLACFGEFAADFTNWFTGGIEERKKLLAKGSTLLLVGSLALELICLVRTNQLSGRIIGSLDERARDAGEKSQIALTKSENAITHAGAAEASSTRAGEKSDKAERSASSALTLAKGARQEADSFEKDIKDAKRDASEAKALLAEVRQLAKESQQHATNAEKGTEQLTTRFSDRTLTDAQVKSIVDKVQSFAGQEYGVTTYWEMKEPMAIANRISRALWSVGWKYLPDEGGKSVIVGVLTGFLIYIHPDADTRTKGAASALVSALNKEGIVAELRLQNPTNNPKHNTIHLEIGTKP